MINILKIQEKNASASVSDYKLEGISPDSH